MSDYSVNVLRYQTLAYNILTPGSSLSYTGRLPAGLSISWNSNTAQITGTCTDSPDSYVVQLLAAATVIHTVTFVVTNPNPLNPPVISCTGASASGGGHLLSVPGGSVSIEFLATNSGANWSGNSLPYGLSLNSNSGIVTGSLSKGEYTLNVQCWNRAWQTDTGSSYGLSQYASYTLYLTVRPELPQVSLSNSSFDGNYTVGDTITETIFSVQSNAKPVTWSASGLPTNIQINETSGCFAGKLTTAGIYDITVTATNSEGESSLSQQIVVAASQSVPTVSLSSNQPGGSSYSLKFTVGAAAAIYFDATNTPTSWSAEDLPSGLAIDAANGNVTGKFKAPGSYRFYVTATNDVGPSVALAVSVTVEGSATEFDFASEDPTLFDIQIDVRTGAVTGTKALAFKQYGLARLALVFTDYGSPSAPPEASSVQMAFKTSYAGDYILTPPVFSLVSAAEGQPAYLLAEIPLDGTRLSDELKALTDATESGSSSGVALTLLSDVCWKTDAGKLRACNTFSSTVSPAVTLPSV